MRPPRRITIEAPAKINLGLEILGKRSDGFHELRSVMAMLDLHDTLTISEDLPSDALTVDGIPPEENLISRALEAFRTRVPESSHLGWSLEKRIPIASGLGGASSDAAAALLGANELADRILSRVQLSDIAATLGSDVPFFLSSPTALSFGRGTDLSPLPAADFQVLVLSPKVSIPHKTRTLFSLVTKEDYSDGSKADQVAEALRHYQVPSPSMLANAFARPLATLLPETGLLHEITSSLSMNGPCLSGAGPTHYILSSEPLPEQAIVDLRKQHGEWLSVITTRTRLEPMSVDLGSIVV